MKRKKIVRLIAPAFLGFAVIGVSQAVDNPGAAGTSGSHANTSNSGNIIPQKAPAELNNGTGNSSGAPVFVTSPVDGVVQSVDRSNQANSRIRIKASSGEISEFTIDENTSIMKNNQQTPFSQIQPGDSITLKRSNP